MLPFASKQRLVFVGLVLCGLEWVILSLYFQYIWLITIMSRIPISLRGLSHQIESEYSEKDLHRKIPKPVLDKYLTTGENSCTDKFDRLVLRATPVWSLTLAQMADNWRGIARSDWPFDEHNQSIYLAVWGPISLVFFAYLLHNQPYQSKFRLLEQGAISLGLTLVLGYFGYVASNMLKHPHCSFFQHLCISSHINLLTIVYSCLCTGGPNYLIVIASIIYVGACTYLHFNLYNQAFKPTLLELVLIFVFILVCYAGAAFLFIKTFSDVDIASPMSTPAVQNVQGGLHLALREFNQLF